MNRLATTKVSCNLPAGRQVKMAKTKAKNVIDDTTINMANVKYLKIK